MTGVTTVSGGYDPEVKNYFDGVLQDRERAFYIYNMFGQVKNIPSKNSKTIICRRQDNFDDTPAVLTEGVTPAYEQASKFDVEIELQQFGKLTAISDLVEITIQSDTANEIADNLSETMFGMLNKATRNTLNSTATPIDCDGGSNGNTPTEVTVGDFDDAVDRLTGYNGRKFTPEIRATDGVGTSPQEQAYWGMMHTDLRKDIRGLSNFTSRSDYPRDEALQSELGSVDEVRLAMSSDGIKSSAATPIYGIMIAARNAYVITSIDEFAMEMIIKELGSGEDGLNQRRTMGAKALFGSGIVDDRWIVNLRATVSS